LNTKFQDVFDTFFDLITDDMYVEQSEEETKKACRSLLMASIPLFEFPEYPLTFHECDAIRGHDHNRYHEDDLHGFEFDYELSLEEVNILAMGMVQIWVQQQVTSIENTRQKYSGADFKMSSQASHLQRLSRVLSDTKDEHRRLQMLHSRRRVGNQGRFESNFDMFVKPMSRSHIARRGVSTGRPKTLKP
jgi:hypothetical protein